MVLSIPSSKTCKDTTNMFWLVSQMLAVTYTASVLRWARWLAHASISPWGLVSSRTDMLRPYSPACRWLYLLYCFWQCLHTFLMFSHVPPEACFWHLNIMSLGFIGKCYLHVCVYCMQFLPWWLNNDFWELECSELSARRGFLGTSERRCRPKKKNRFLVASQANQRVRGLWKSCQLKFQRWKTSWTDPGILRPWSWWTRQ